ncbi:hypothetical protein C2869_05160 [Saccharobesus litoralis]|uniref:Tripartite tricarboxylate transporter TctB family protein n=1 Tax=Saccharobesus litoralis TaxID=2172099 RepID=A0A2S0VNS0_9ALTE|nr:hypothetical protein [Saccharobesus litoralis]AWB65865.1 hypothetical protein C2869_05160 [Saccharobesus litoralis]
MSQLMLRRADLRIALVLLLVCLALIVETLSYPMTGDYAGVESKWYVSPALFPLILLILLSLACVFVLQNALRNGGAQQLFKVSSWLGQLDDKVNLDRWYVIGLLSAYVYVYIPSFDFYLATSLFLLSACYRFYFKHASLAWVSLFNLAVVSSVLLLRGFYAESFYLLSTELASDEALIAITDGVILFEVLAFMTWVVVSQRQAAKQLAYLILTCFVMPLVLIIIFQFLLYVPMPVEYGVINQMLETLWYVKLGWQ